MHSLKLAKKLGQFPGKDRVPAISGRLFVVSPSQNFTKITKNLTNMFQHIFRVLDEVL